MEEISTYSMKNSAIMRISFDEKIIDTAPEYQRFGDIWTLEKKQLLIDSILNDYDIPKLYFHVLKEPKILSNGKKVQYSIIDGRQRLETIWAFQNNKFPLSDDFKYNKDENVKAAGFTYSDLAVKYPELKVIFDSFVLPIVCVETTDIELIEDMFSRLNEAVPLNAAEKRNALGGPMALTINVLSEHRFFQSKVRISNKRYQYKEVAVRLLFLEESIGNNKLIDTKKVYLDGFVRKYKTNPTLDRSSLENSVKYVLNIMADIFVDKDDLLRSQGRIPIYYLLFKAAVKFNKISVVTRSKLVEFENDVENNKLIAEQNIAEAKFELLEYDRLTIQGTNDASSIRERLYIISNYFDIPKLF